MGKCEIQFKADLENVSSLSVPADQDWTVFVKCSLCGEVHDKPVTMNESELLPLPPKGRTEANFVMKCKLCGRTSSMSIKSVKPYSASGEYQTVMTIDGRGFEVARWIPDRFVGAGVNDSGAEYEVEIEDLEDGWCDFDDRFDLPLSVLDIETRVI